MYHYELAQLLLYQTLQYSEYIFFFAREKKHFDKTKNAESRLVRKLKKTSHGYYFFEKAFKKILLIE